MTKITSGHTLVAKGTLNGPHYLAVEAGGGVKAANGAVNNYEIIIHGSTTAGAAGGYGGVLVNATVTNRANGTVVVFGGGSGTNPNGAGGSLAIDGTLVNQGLIEALQQAYAGGPPQLSVAATGYLINEATVFLTGAEGSVNVPFATIGGSTLDVTGVMLNGGLLSVGGGKLGLGYSGKGAQVVVNSPGGSASLQNLGTIAIHGAYPGSTSPSTYPGAGGAVTISNATFVNDDQITIGAATNTASLYGGAGGVLLTNGTANVLNAGTIIVDGQSTGAGLTAPGGTLSIGGQAFYTTGAIKVEGATVAGGSGGVLNVSTSLHINGQVYVRAGYNGGLGGTANLGGLIYIGGPTTAGTLTLGSINAPGVASATVTGDLFLEGGGRINIDSSDAHLTVARTGEVFDDNGSIAGDDPIVNNGYFAANGAYEFIGPTIVNNGVLVVSGGFVHAYYGAGTGTFNIQDGGTLYFEHALGSGSTINFDSTPGKVETFATFDPYSVGATLAGINDTAVLDIVGFGVTGVSTSGTQLFVTAGPTFTFNLAAPLPDGTQFTLNPDGRFGTAIGFVLPGGAVPAGQGPGSYHGLERASGADPASLFSGHLTAS